MPEAGLMFVYVQRFSYTPISSAKSGFNFLSVWIKKWVCEGEKDILDPELMQEQYEHFYKRENFTDSTSENLSKTAEYKASGC